MKSHVNDLYELATSIYKDAVAKCAAELEVRDLMTMKSRSENEGLSFFTITLPDLGKDFDRCLDQGQIGPTHFRSFRKYGKIPAFLRGFFARIFSRETGGILDEPDISSIEAIRQMAYSFKKIKLDCSEKRARKALSSFIQIEQDFDDQPSPLDKGTFEYLCRHLWDIVLADINMSTCNFVPKHGPGATEERISGNQKYVHKLWYERLEPYFPLFHFAFPNENAYGCKEFQNLTLISEEHEHPVRVVQVPKTLKSPRTIAIEPVCMQYTQQAISRVLVKTLESNWITRGHINFTDQSVNQKLAMTSSKHQKYATIDMSDASDRVSNEIAGCMFRRYPDLFGAIQACRSKKAQMPDGTIVSLRKFASMGSALCFPIEAMYFFTICIVARLRKHALPVTSYNIYKMSRDVFIYGDDIIVPTDDAAVIIDYLHRYKCKVNAHKSFWTGKFRESCGTDAYDGEDVTPTYIRSVPPDNKRDASAIVSWVASSNSFYKKGYWRTATHLIERCESIIGALPIVGPNCAGLGKVSFQHFVSAERWNKDHHVHEVRTWCAVPVYRKDRLEGYGALTKCLLKLESDNVAPTDKDHLVRSARYGAVALKRRWVRPY